MEVHTSQNTEHTISIKQVCFIVKELLGIFEHEGNEHFVRNLIELLPKICAKLQNVVNTLREESDGENREAARLLLCLLTKIFSWKGFESVTYNILLRGMLLNNCIKYLNCYYYGKFKCFLEGLRTLASQVDESNCMLRSCKELVAESCKYFESLSDIATQISLAIALINMCQSLMKHSESYTKLNKEKYGKQHYAQFKVHCKVNACI